MPQFKAFLNGLFSNAKFSTTLLGSTFGGTLSLPYWDMPALHNLVQRMPPVAAAGAKPEAARFTINWLSAAGTGVFDRLHLVHADRDGEFVSFGDGAFHFVSTAVQAEAHHLLGGVEEGGIHWFSLIVPRVSRNGLSGR